jgi:hypothetical protein
MQAGLQSRCRQWPVPGTHAQLRAHAAAPGCAASRSAGDIGASWRASDGVISFFQWFN